MVLVLINIGSCRVRGSNGGDDGDVYGMIW